MTGTRVVVTGGLGFIGTHVCAALAAAGYEPVAVDDRSGAQAQSASRSEWETVEVDAASAPLAGAAGVIHLAAVPGVRTHVPSRVLARRNVALAADLAAAAARRGIRFVLASTSSVYGDASMLPTPEHAPLDPLNPYARSKVGAEAACPEAIVARLFTVYGPGQRPDMAFARWIDALGRGVPVAWCAPEAAARDFTYVGDAARGLVAALERGRSGQAYNIAGEGPVPVRDALAQLELIVGRRAHLSVHDAGVSEARVTAACLRKSNEELGYSPRVALRDGLELQVEAAATALAPLAA